MTDSPTPTPEAFARVFEGRSRNSWSSRAVTESQVRELYDIVKLGPTSMNSSPARFRFLLSAEARERLATHALATNADKIRAAPCVAIIAWDSAFFEEMPRLFPIREGVRDMFAANNRLSSDTAFRNSTLQGAYLMVAARMLGLDCGPMSGFDAAAVDVEFFATTTLKTNFLCALGYADDEPFPRLPRLPFEDAAQVL